MSILTALLLAAPAAVTPTASAPAPPAALPPAPHLRAVRTPTPPAVDGKLDDAVWKLAPASDHFTQKYPNDGVPPSDPTTVRVLYDDDAVYVAFDCPQEHTPVVGRLTRRDRNVESDGVLFDLGTRGDHKSSFEFAVDPSGTLVDAIRYNDTDYSPDWDENWEARTDVTEHGWTAEFRIPLRILRFPSLPVQSWDFQAGRHISNRQENDDWSYFPRSVGGEVSHYGRLDGLEGLKERMPLELRPFVVSRLRRRDPGQGQLASGTDFLASAGLDVKWHPTQDLTLDATFNPDFAQVEADQIVLNLSTVEQYYPEKRPFFLEGIDTFTTPFQLLYTRRIGRVPPFPALNYDATLSRGENLVDVPEPSAIYGATKLTGRIGEKWSIGTVQAVTAKNTVQVQVPTDAGTGVRQVARLLDPTSTFNLVRLKRDLGDNAHLAFTATAVTHSEPTETYPLFAPGAELCPIPVQLTPFQQTYTTPAPRARCFNDAYVGAVDWRWRSPGGDYATGGQVVSTVLKNGPDRPVADGTVIHPGDVGFAGKAYLSKEGGKHWTGGVDADLESRKFEINDLGYNARANQLAGDAFIEYRDLDPRGIFLERHTELWFGTQYDAAGLLVGQGTGFKNYGRLKGFWNVGLNFYYRGNKYDDREIGDGTALQRDGAVGSNVWLWSDPSKRVSFGFEDDTDIAWDGYTLRGDGTLTVRLLTQWDLDLMPTWQKASGEPRFLPGAAQGASLGNNPYLFGRLEANSVGLTLRTTYMFAPRLSLQAYAQLFLASAHYHDFSQYQANPNGPRPAILLSQLTPYTARMAQNPDFEEGVLNINLVLRWEYRLGSTMYLVYTRSQVPTTVVGENDVGSLNLSAIGRAPASDVLLAKVSFWWGL